MCKRRSSCPAPPLFQSAHPALYHVICYPTIYNCIKTHTHSETISSYRATLNEHGSSSSPPKPNNCPIQFYAMFNILFILLSRSHVVGAVVVLVVGPNLILDWLITARLSLLVDLWIFKSIWQLTPDLGVYCKVGRQIIDGHTWNTYVMCRYDGYMSVYSLFNAIKLSQLFPNLPTCFAPRLEDSLLSQGFYDITLYFFINKVNWIFLKLATFNVCCAFWRLHVLTSIRNLFKNHPIREYYVFNSWKKQHLL